MLHLLWTIIIGLAAGIVAKLILPGKDPGGLLITMVLGVAGSLLATLLGRLVGWYHPGESGGFIAAIIGAVILLLIYRFIKRKSAA